MVRCLHKAHESVGTVCWRAEAEACTHTHTHTHTHTQQTCLRGCVLPSGCQALLQRAALLLQVAYGERCGLLDLLTSSLSLARRELCILCKLAWCETCRCIHMCQQVSCITLLHVRATLSSVVQACRRCMSSPGALRGQHLSGAQSSAVCLGLSLAAEVMHRTWPRLELALLPPGPCCCLWGGESCCWLHNLRVQHTLSCVFS